MAEYLATLSLLIIIVLLVRGFFRKSISPTVMYALWLVVVLRLCLPFPLFRVEMDLPAWQETIPQEQQGQQGAADSGIDPDTVTPPVADTPSVPDTPPVIIPTTPVIPSIPSVPTVPSVPENPAAPGENPMPDVPVTPEVPVTPPAPIDWMRVAVTVWISGSAILALWFAITGIVYHYRLITHRTLYKTLRKTKVYLTEDESAPCLAGVIPAIYIPPVEMDEDFRAFIVLHEYMHLRHGDHVWAVVRILALIAHWWNPLVWAAVILSKRDAELACDHAVAAQLNRENRLEYARVLLDTIPQKQRYAVGLGSAPMKERILRLTKTQKNRILCVVLAVIITAAAVGCSFIGLKDREEENGENTGDQPVVDEPIDDEPIDDEPIDDKPIDDEPIDDEPIDDEPIVIHLPDNFAEFYHEAERVYALFTGYRANIYTEGKFSDDGVDYQAVDIGGCTTMAGLRALCEQYFDAALTDELLSTTVMNQYPLYREHNGKLYRFSGYAAQFGYDIGDNYTMTSVQAENGKHTVRVDAVWNEGGRVVPGRAMCTYTVNENGEIRFTSFALMAQALCEEWGQGTPDTPKVEPSTLHDYKNKKLVNSLVYEGYTVAYELPHPTYEGQTFDFHIHLPQIDDDSPSAEKWNTDIVNAYDAKYSSYLSGSASGTNRNFYAEIRYETVTTGDVVTIYILNSCGVLNSGDARRSYDIYHYDTKGKRFLTTNEFLAYYAEGQFADYTVADIVAFMNEHAFNTDEAGTPLPLTEANIQGVIPSVFGGGKFDVVYQGYNMEGKFATRTLFSPYPTSGNPHRYTYRLTYHDYTDCHTAEMNGRPAGYRLLLSQRVEGQYDAGYYVDCLFTEDIAERPESYPQSVYGEYYTPVRDDAYGNMYIVTDHGTDRGQLQAWIPFDQPSAAQDYYRGVLLGYFNYDRLFGGNYTVEKSVGSMIASVLDAYRNGKDPNELLPASETKFTPYPAKSVRANPGDKEIRAILDAATVDESGIIRLRVDLGEGYILELPMELGIFGESYQAYFTGIYFIKQQKVTTQGPFIGYVADKTTPWIDLYTEKNGTYVGRIPYEIFHDWIATDRDRDTWKSGWMAEYVCFYYAEFGDFRWAAAHLRDTVLGSGRKNVATSADGGKTWDIGSTRDNYGGNHVVGMGFATDKIAFISYDPYNEHDGADGPVISRTTDGGKTWKLLEISLPDSLGGQKLISGIPFYDGDLLRRYGVVARNYLYGDVVFFKPFNRFNGVGANVVRKGNDRNRAERHGKFIPLQLRGGMRYDEYP